MSCVTGQSMLTFLMVPSPVCSHAPGVAPPSQCAPLPSCCALSVSHQQKSHVTHGDIFRSTRRQIHSFLHHLHLLHMGVLAFPSTETGSTSLLWTSGSPFFLPPFSPGSRKRWDSHHFHKSRKEKATHVMKRSAAQPLLLPPRHHLSPRKQGNGMVFKWDAFTPFLNLTAQDNSKVNFLPGLT